MLNIIITNAEAICASPAEGNALHFDPTRLTPEQIEQFKTLLGIGSSNEQQPSTPVAFDHSMFDPEQLTPLQMVELSRRFQFHEIEEDLEFREVVGRIVDNPTEPSEMIGRVVTSILGEGQQRYVWGPGFAKDDYDTVYAGLDEVKTQEEMFKHILKTLTSIDYMLAQISGEFLKRFYNDF